MKRRIIGVLAALVLAIVGTFALVNYVQSAKDHALAGESLVEVYVLSENVPADTPITVIKQMLSTIELPEKALVDDAVRDLEQLDDNLVAAVELQAGEQLLASRLVDEQEMASGEIPAGLQAVTVALEPARAVGGAVAAGDTVGVVLSFDPFDLDEATPEPDAPAPGVDPATTGADATGADSAGDKTPNMTHLTFHKVLVTSVQFDQDESTAVEPTEEAEEGDETTEVRRAPSKELLVTLAVSSPQVEQIVFAAEFGHIWLTHENADADESGTRIVTLGDVYDEAGAQR